jgi:hypothetical protein
MYLREGDMLTARKACFSFLNLDNMRGIEWFRTEDYVDDIGSYGAYIGYYSILVDFPLLNLGCAKDRKIVTDYTTLTECDLNPDTQYSGHVSNLKVHMAIESSLSLQHFGGTVMSKLHTDDELKEYLEGPDEVVIFMHRVRDRIVLTGIQQDDFERHHTGVGSP